MNSPVGGGDTLTTVYVGCISFTFAGSHRCWRRGTFSQFRLVILVEEVTTVEVWEGPETRCGKMADQGIAMDFIHKVQP